ncbi:PAS domain S-box protein, partial [Streptomyces sp. NPDC001274]
MWQSSPPGSIYDYIRVASFSIGPDGRIEQWSRRAAGLFGMGADKAVGMDPVDVFMPASMHADGRRRVAE